MPQLVRMTAAFSDWPWLSFCQHLKVMGSLSAKESSITSDFQVRPPPLPCPLQTVGGREGAASFHHHLPQSNSDKQVFLVSKVVGKRKKQTNKQTTNSGPKATLYHHTPTSHTNHKPWVSLLVLLTNQL